jgi:RNA polymerase sigma factor (sigma-70 family)
MPSQVNEVVQFLRRTALRHEEGGQTDGQLLARFLEQRDEAALAALMGRHGPMVWGVCRRLLPSHHDAEDAFQASFLVLVRKAASVRPREMVGNWLYGVAHQTAMNARAMLAKRRAREMQGVAMPEIQAPAPDAWHDLHRVLDQELSRLPDKYRVAIVLCDLEGKTRHETARQLGLPEGTLAGHLTRGRAMLARRFARQGLALSGTALVTALTQQAASASLPTAVMNDALKAVARAAAGQVAGAAISARVAALTQGTMKSMLLRKLKIALTLVVALTVTGTGVRHGIVRPQVADIADSGQPLSNGGLPGRAESVAAAPEPEPQKAPALDSQKTPLTNVGCYACLNNGGAP